MSGSVFFATLRRHWRAMIYWGLGIASMALYIVVLIPDSKTLQQYAKLLDSLPKFMVAGLGGTDTAFIATPGGFLAYGFFGWIMVVLAAYGVVVGLNITANEEDRGIMDVLLSMPVPRWRIIVEKFLAYAVAVVVIVGMSLVVLLVGVGRSDSFNLSTQQLIASTFNMIPPTLLVMAFTAFIATLVRRRSTAIGISAAFVAASYFIDFIGKGAGLTTGVRNLSFFTYYDATGVMQNGLVVLNVLGLLVVALLMFGGTIWAFQRRDVGL